MICRRHSAAGVQFASVWPRRTERGGEATIGVQLLSAAVEVRVTSVVAPVLAEVVQADGIATFA